MVPLLNRHNSPWEQSPKTCIDLCHFSLTLSWLGGWVNGWKNGQPHSCKRNTKKLIWLMVFQNIRKNMAMVFWELTRQNIWAYNDCNIFEDDFTERWCYWVSPQFCSSLICCQSVKNMERGKRNQEDIHMTGECQDRKCPDQHSHWVVVKGFGTPGSCVPDWWPVSWEDHADHTLLPGVPGHGDHLCPVLSDYLLPGIFVVPVHSDHTDWSHRQSNCSEEPQPCSVAWCRRSYHRWRGSQDP